MALTDQDRIQFIKGLRSPSEHQVMLVRLSETAERTAAEDKLLQALLKVEAARERSEKAKAAAASLNRGEQNSVATELSQRANALLRARQRRLIALGALIDLAELQDRSHEELLGLLIAGKDIATQEAWKNWQQRGTALLARSITATVDDHSLPP